jgi:hypothetical protein
MKKAGMILFTIFAFWIAGTITIYRFVHPEKSETELFFKIPQAAVLDFKE